MSESIDRRFGDLVVRRGILTAAQFEREMRLRDGTAAGMPMQQWLQRRGQLTPEQNTEISRAFVEENKERRKTAHPTPAAPAGARRLGRYTLLAELGRGGMGVVYRVFDPELRRELALKTLLLGKDPNPQVVERFLREAHTASTLRHPGIVPIHDIGVADGVPYYVMDLVHGKPFDQVMREGRLPVLADRVRIIRDVARAVAHAHERRVIHRDLKPGNVLIDGTGGVHVMDMGLAKRIDDCGQLTGTSEVLGTPKYLAPEQLDGVRDHSGPQSDVYALGVMLYEALTGRSPFQGAGLTELLTQILRARPVPPRQVDPAIPADLERICLKALDKDPTKRHADAGALAADLERALGV